MDHIEQAIQSALEAIPGKAAAEQWQGGMPWTIAVKAALVEVGREFGWLTAASQCENDNGREWLYDVVWYQLDQATHLTDVPLVAESEWGGEEQIKEDFEKLLVARSKYRVMVFQADSEEAVRKLQSKMHLWIAKFHQTAAGDRYLLAGLARNRWLFDCHVS